MEIVIHTIDHHESRFDVESGGAEEQILQNLHPDKAFGHHHLSIFGRRWVSMFVTDTVTYVELGDVEGTEWPFYEHVFRAHRASDNDFHGSTLQAMNGCVLAELHLSDGKRLKLLLEPLAQGEVIPCAKFMIEELLASPSLHVYGKAGTHVLVNGKHIVRCDFEPCAAVEPSGWQGEATEPGVTLQ